MTEEECRAEREEEFSRRRGNAASTPDRVPDRFRTLPNSVETEKGLLASLFLAPDYVFQLLLRHGASDGFFYHPAHGIIFREAKEFYESGKPFDQLLFLESLHGKGLLEQCGGGSYLSEIFTYVPTAANASHYASICDAKATLREVIRECTELASEAYEAETEGAAAIVEKMEVAATALALRRHARTHATTKETVQAVIERCAAGKNEETWGISTGYANLDAVMRGLRKKAMVAIGGETSAGKTSLALNIVHEVCVKRHYPTLIFSLEMPREEVLEVLLQIGSGVNADNFITGKVDLYERERFLAAGTAIANAPLTIRDECDVSISELRSVARALKPRLIVVDYAQLVSGNRNRKYENRTTEIEEVSRGGKKMAGELDATTILLTQLNDEGKVAGSRAIAKDADQLLIVRDGPKPAEKIVAVCKQRRGPKEELAFRWIAPCQKFLAKALT